MTLQNTPEPQVLPDPPDVWTSNWMSNYTRVLTTQLIQMLARNALMGTTLNLNRLPTSATGLRSGDIWRDPAASHVLKVVP